LTSSPPAGRSGPRGKLRSALAALVALPLALAVSACATSDVQTVRLAQTPYVTGKVPRDRAPRTRRVPRPGSGEYLRSWGVTAVGADAAYRASATGRGVTIALVDTGVPRGARDLSVSRASVDLIENRVSPKGPDGDHAQSVAGPLASILNGKGILGLAYDSTLLSIRADMDGACAVQCAFRTYDVARGIDYALKNKARIIILAMVSPTPDKPLSATLDKALSRAVDAGAIVVIAGGNTGSAEPAWPARFASNPRYGGQVIAVGATNLEGELADWSVRAGSTRDSFLAAPGAQIITDCGTRYCSMVSGTSFSAPYVAGAAALLMDAYPKLTGREVAQLLLTHAKDLGEPGPDAVYGQGALDVAAAFKAAGAMAQAGGAAS
jgi:subtilisin family serine protease